MPLTGRILDRLKQRRAGGDGGFRRDERGATAIEFAILALPFFALMGAILETAVVFLASQLLDSAVQDASRLVRTGQAADFDVAAFNAEICKGLVGLFDCTQLKTEVKPIGSFAAGSEPDYTQSPLNPTDPTKWTLAPAFNPGTGSQVMIVRVYYKWPVIINFGGFSLATDSDGTHLMAAVRVFANEPFTAGSS